MARVIGAVLYGTIAVIHHLLVLSCTSYGLRFSLDDACDWRYSSARNYHEGSGLIEIATYS